MRKVWEGHARASSAHVVACVTLLGITGHATGLPPNPDLDNWRGPRNNCYNYAINQKDNDFKQPGGLPWPGAGGPAVLTVMQWCDKVMGRAAGDGLVNIAWQPGQPIPAPPQGFNLVAFGAVAGTKGRDDNTDGDYHWWRLNGDGSWSHKRGQQAAKTTYTDANRMEQPLTDPRDPAQTDGYTLCGFMGVPKNPRPANHIDPGLQAPSSGVRVWDLRYSGFEDYSRDFVGFDATLLMSHLPTISPANEVPNPNWVDGIFRDDRGFSFLPGSGITGFPAYMQCFNGVVAVYSDLDGTEIRYYNDNNGLCDFVPAPGSVMAFGLAAGLFAVRRRK